MEKVHNNEINYLYCSLNIDRVIKLRRIRCALHVELGGEERRGLYRFVVGKGKVKKPLGRPSR